MFDFIDCLEAEIVPGYEPKRLPPVLEGAEQGLQSTVGSSLQPEEPTLWDVGRGGSSCPVLGAVAGTPCPGRWYPASVTYPREMCMVSVLFPLLRSLRLKLSGSLRPAGMILNTLVIFGAWLFTQSSKHHL